MIVSDENYPFLISMQCKDVPHRVSVFVYLCGRSVGALKEEDGGKEEGDDLSWK